MRLSHRGAALASERFGCSSRQRRGSDCQRRIVGERADVGAFYARCETLAFGDADLDLNHVEPAGVLGRVVELDPPEHAARFRSVGSGARERHLV